jgi:hypothetical protein
MTRTMPDSATATAIDDALKSSIIKLSTKLDTLEAAIKQAEEQCERIKGNRLTRKGSGSCKLSTPNPDCDLFLL